MDSTKRLDILNALACLKDMCASFETCTGCPVYNGVCLIKYSDPEQYDLNTEDEMWRALK